MAIPTLKAKTRERSGTRAARRLRREDVVPVVLYGRGEPNVMLSVQQQDIEHMLDEHHLIMRVEFDGDSAPVQVKEIQYDHLGEHVIHADFGRISLTETVQITVPIETHGDAVGVEEGGVLDVMIHELQIECLPTEIPEKVRVEVGALNIGDDVRVNALTVPKGVKVLEDPDAVVVMVAQPMEMEEPEEEVESLAAEPEVIGREAEEDEGETATGGGAEE